MQEVARGQPNGLAAFENGTDDVGGQEGITDCLAHAVRWDGVFDGNLLIGFACFDSVEPGEGVGDIAQECAVDGFRGVAQNELGLDAVLPPLSVGEMTLRLYAALNYSQNSARTFAAR